MKKLICTILFAIGLMACSSSCVKKESQPISITPEVTVLQPSCDGGSCSVTITNVSPQVIVGDFWEITIPSTWNKKTSIEPEIKAFFVDEDGKNIAMATEEETDSSFEEYVIISLRSLRDHNINVISSKTILQNGYKIAQISSENGDAKAWMWITVKDKIAFSLSCATQINDDRSNGEDCLKIGSSLKLK